METTDKRTHAGTERRAGKSAARHSAQLWISVIALIGGMAMVAVGIAVPPMGEIHPTVLVAFGEALTYSGAVLGIDYHHRFKIKDKK